MRFHRPHAKSLELLAAFFLVASVATLTACGGNANTAPSNANTASGAEKAVTVPEASYQAAGADLPNTLITPATGTSLDKPARNTVYNCLGGTITRPAVPWLNGGTIDLSKKPSIEGTMSWSSQFTESTTATERHFKGNGLPTSGITGRYPVEKGSVAYPYYAHPIPAYPLAADVPIKPWNLDITVPLNPEVAAAPTCLTLQTIGVSLTGVPIHGSVAFLSSNNEFVDPLAAFALDLCAGNPSNVPTRPQYHLHGPAFWCFKDQGDPQTHSPLVGYAIDGFGMYGIRGENGKPVTNADLDECHGRTHPIEWDGQMRTMYHYHLNAEYPYNIGCFRGTLLNSQLGDAV